MVDIVDAQTRARMMSGIRGKNTRPEMAIRQYLHARGFRFRLHRKDLPGSPDLVLAKYRLAVFVHGCFWHRHRECYYATAPATRSDFWRLKLDGNVERDQRQQQALEALGWRVLTVWECGLKHCFESLSDVEGIIFSSPQISEWPAEPPRQRTKLPSSPQRAQRS